MKSRVTHPSLCSVCVDVRRVWITHNCLKSFGMIFQSRDWVVLPFNLNCPCAVTMPTAGESFSFGWPPSVCVFIYVCASPCSAWQFSICCRKYFICTSWGKYVCCTYTWLLNILFETFAFTCCCNHLFDSDFQTHFRPGCGDLLPFKLRSSRRWSTDVWC